MAVHMVKKKEPFVFRKTHSIIHKGICTPMFTATLFTIARTWKQPKGPSTDKWIKELWYIYKMQYYSLSCRILKNDTHELIYKTETDP